MAGADASSYPAVNTSDALLRRINSAYEEIVGKLIALSYPGWRFGDSNYTALPTGLFTLVNGQADYQLTGNGTTGIDTTTPLLNAISFSVKDVNGIWKVLQPIQYSTDILPTDRAEYLKTDGMPAYYEKREDFATLYPAPDNGVSVTLASGLKVDFQRTASVFTAAEVATGTKTPGFASPYHAILAYKAALPYAIQYKPERANQLRAEIARLEKDLFDFYSEKERDVTKVITMERKNYR